MAAAAAGQEDTALALLRGGATVDTADFSGASALMYAAKYGSEAVARTLLLGAAAINLTRETGMTCLHDAAAAGHDSTVRLLIKEGASVNAVNKEEMTPLMLASAEGHEHAALVLLQNGADITRAAATGETALALAMTHEVATRLLQAGARQADMPPHLLPPAEGGRQHEAPTGRKVPPLDTRAAGRGGQKGCKAVDAGGDGTAAGREGRPAALSRQQSFATPLRGRALAEGHADEGIDFLKVRIRKDDSPAARPERARKAEPRQASSLTGRGAAKAPAPTPEQEQAKEQAAMRIQKTLRHHNQAQNHGFKPPKFSFESPFEC
uniref:Uncharacterized protein n=1 Tax=Haptolina ericina TaxID=156174 RepID=A0A7S3AIA0_9EUKA